MTGFKMLFDDTQALMTATNDGLSTPRQVEFSEALDRYIAGYAAENRRRLPRPAEGHLLQSMTALVRWRTVNEDRQVPLWRGSILTP